MDEQVKFYKGNESDLPTSGIEVGAFYHCEDTKNTYRGISATQLELYSSALGEKQIFINNKGKTVYVDSYGHDHSILSTCPEDAKIELHGNNLLACTDKVHKQQMIVGRYNAPNSSPFIVGAGTATQRLNALAVNENGVYHDHKKINPLIMRADLYCSGSNYTIDTQSIEFDSSVLGDLLQNHYFMHTDPLVDESNVYMILNQVSYNPFTHPLAKLQLITVNASELEQNNVPVFAGPIQMWGYQLWCTVRGTALQEDILDQPTYQWDVSITTMNPIKLQITAIEGNVAFITSPFPLVSKGVYEIIAPDDYCGVHITQIYDTDRDETYFIKMPLLVQEITNGTKFIFSGDDRFYPFEHALNRPTRGIRNYITNNTNTEKRPSFNAPVLLGNIGDNEPSEAFGQAHGRYLTSTINKDKPIMADLASGTISAPGGLVIEETYSDVSLTTKMASDNFNISYNELDLTYGAEMQSGYLCLTSTEEDNYTCSNTLSYEAIEIEKVTEDDDKVLDINASSISFENRSSRCALSANDNGSVLALGCNDGADYSIKSHIVSGHPILTIRCDSTNEEILTSYASTTQIQTPNCLVDGLQVDSDAHFVSDVEIDGGAYIDGLFESGSGVYSYNTVYAEGNITSENNIYAQGDIEANGDIDAHGTITGNKVYGAVWNDYAEFRAQTTTIEPGYCVTSSNNGLVSKTTEKLQACDGIVSDTYGFAIGETDKCQTPLAVAGRVLAYCEGDRNSYNAGDTVCAGPDGKVCKMTREEIREWPDRIVGIVSEIPNYETWGSGNIPVNGRIWIKIK